jgi:hypothetical protein
MTQLTENDPTINERLAPTSAPEADKYADQRPWDGPYDGKPSELNYRTLDRCDTCEKRKLGTMYHARGATGRVCPVLFLCDICDNTVLG